MGIIVAGSYYPSIGSSFGLGYQLGATSTKEITTGGMTSTPDGPLTWRGGITGQYRTDVSPLLGIEIGAGLLFERAKDSDSSSGTLITMTVSDINLLTSATLLVNLTDDFSLVGGIDLALPLYASIKIRSGGLMVQPDVKVKGSAFQGRLGVVFNI